MEVGDTSIRRVDDAESIVEIEMGDAEGDGDFIFVRMRVTHARQQSLAIIQAKALHAARGIVAAETVRLADLAGLTPAQL